MTMRRCLQSLFSHDDSRRGVSIIGLLLLLSGFVSVADGRATEVDLSQPDLQRKPSLQIADGEVQLSLEQAIKIALERNLSLVIERYRVQEADLVIKQNRGIYDLFGTVDFQALEDTSPTSSNLQAGLDEDVQEFERQNWNFGLDQLTPTGGTVILDWINQRDESNSQFATLNPSYSIDLDLSFRQPLMRDLGKMATDRSIIIARTNKNISEENFEQQVTAVILAVEEAYWNLAENIAQLEVAIESEALAVQLHEQNKIRVEVGTLAPLELVQSEAGVADREVEIIRARARVGDSADVLRQLLNIERSEEFWAMPINPTSDPFSEFFEVDVDAAIETALAERPELRSGYLDLSNRELDVRYFRNQQRPRLDLALTYGLNGVGGDVTERDFFTGEVFGTSQGDYGDAIDQIRHVASPGMCPQSV